MLRNDKDKPYSTYKKTAALCPVGILSCPYQTNARGKKYKPQYTIYQHYPHTVIAGAARVYKSYCAVYKAYYAQHGKQRPENPFQIHNANICNGGKRSVPSTDMRLDDYAICDEYNGALFS